MLQSLLSITERSGELSPLRHDRCDSVYHWRGFVETREVPAAFIVPCGIDSRRTDVYGRAP